MTDDDPGVRLDHRDLVSTITLDRPDRLNALGPAGVLELLRLLQGADDEPTTNVIVLTGAGRAFCAGGDVKTFGSMPDHRVRRRGARLVDAMLDIEKPIVAKVNGPAIGLGLTLALLADCAIASDDAKLGDPHVNLGVAAGDGVAFLLPALVGPQRAKELLMTGRSISGREAADMGMINRAVPSSELDAAVDALVADLVAQPTYALRATKVAINRFVKSDAAEVLDVALAYEEISRHLPEYDVAVQAWKDRAR